MDSCASPRTGALRRGESAAVELILPAHSQSLEPLGFAMEPVSSGVEPSWFQWNLQSSGGNPQSSRGNPREFQWNRVSSVGTLQFPQEPAGSMEPSER